jgi:hypothetical protein
MMRSCARGWRAIARHERVNPQGEGVMEERAVLRFVPSRVTGLADVSEVVVHADRLEVQSAGEWIVFPFAKMVAWPHPAAIWRLLARLGWRPRLLPVGEKDWFHPPSKRFIRFCTQPRLVIYMPDEPEETNYGDTLFWRIQEVMLEGGFMLCDLG